MNNNRNKFRLKRSHYFASINIIEGKSRDIILIQRLELKKTTVTDHWTRKQIGFNTVHTVFFSLSCNHCDKWKCDVEEVCT